MTTIAWSGDVVAVDSQGKAGNYRKSKECVKLRRDGETVFACTGAFAMFDAMIEWYKEGHIPDKVPVSKDPEERIILIVFTSEGRCFTYTNLSPFPDENFAPDAWGSGYQYAIGAMKHGASAKRAVEIACDCDTESGGPVRTIDLS